MSWELERSGEGARKESILLQRQQAPCVFRERLCLGAAAPANWGAVINGQCLFLTQVVFLRINVPAFMEVFLIEL